MSLIVKLPWPDPGLMPNRKNGRHWGGTQIEKVSARWDAHILTKAAGGFKAPDGNIPISLLFLCPDGRARDLDNLLAAMKPAIDGVASALGVDDSRFRPILIDKIHSKKPGGVIVAVGVAITSFVDWPI